MFKYIKSMSYDKRTLENKLFSVVDKLTEHLVKLYMFPSSEMVNHWRKEVWNLLNMTHKLKSTNKFPSSRWIYNIISGYNDMGAEFIESVSREYKRLTPERNDPTELEHMIDSYVSWLSDMLSQNGTVSSEEVYEKLEDLGL